LFLIIILSSTGDTMPIQKQEFIERMKRLQASVLASELGAFLVTAQDSIYYLTGVTYAPLERPFFILVRPEAAPVLLAPTLDREHLASAPNVGECVLLGLSSPPDLLGEALLEMVRYHACVEPSLSQEIAQVISAWEPRCAAG
jgi:Xaa-Pro aminopeptidase